MDYSHKKKSCIIFDLADTLISLNPKPEEIIHKYFREKYSIDLNKLEIRKSLIILSNIFHYSSINIQNSKQREEFYLNYNNHLLNILGVRHLTSPKNIYEAIKKEKPNWYLKKDILKTLINLRNDNYKIGLISNFNSIQANKILLNNNIKELIDFTHISENEGLEKPNVLFYEKFLLKYNLDKNYCLYIGDSYSLDYIPSQSINLPFILLDEINLFPNIENRVSNIKEIFDFLN